MCLTVIICTVLFGSATFSAADDLRCRSISEIDSKTTPVELTKGTIDCIRKGRYQEGVSMYLLMGAYGWFDKMRVVDESAHQAIPALKMYISDELSRDDRNKKWVQAVDRLMENKNLARFCASVRKIGMPAYYPDYMIKHGLAAFNNPEKATVYADFDAEMVWKNSLQGYLKCK